MFKPCSRESESQKKSAPLARRFKQTNLALPTGGLSNPIVRMGRSPPPMSRLSGGGIYVVRHSSHSVEDTNLQILYACLVTHDAKA